MKSHSLVWYSSCSSDVLSLLSLCQILCFAWCWSSSMLYSSNIMLLFLLNLALCLFLFLLVILILILILDSHSSSCCDFNSCLSLCVYLSNNLSFLSKDSSVLHSAGFTAPHSGAVHNCRRGRKVITYLCLCFISVFWFVFVFHLFVPIVFILFVLMFTNYSWFSVLCFDCLQKICRFAQSGKRWFAFGWSDANSASRPTARGQVQSVIQPSFLIKQIFSSFLSLIITFSFSLSLFLYFIVLIYLLKEVNGEICSSIPCQLCWEQDTQRTSKHCSDPSTCC